MIENLVSVKNYLGKYYPELFYSSMQEKYKGSGLDTIFEQRFYIQNNKIQMIVDPTLTGLSMIVEGNEIVVSKALYDHTGIVVSNSIEAEQNTNLKSFYNADIFSSVAYLICQNQISIRITESIDEPVYVKYRSGFETFYNSVITFDIAGSIEVEIIEEFESCCVLNIAATYNLHPYADLNLITFYQNPLSAVSYCVRNIMSHDFSRFNHTLFGKGAECVIDETKIRTMNHSVNSMKGVVASCGKNFHSILHIDPLNENYKISVDYKNIIEGDAKVAFFPVISATTVPQTATIDVSEIDIDEIPANKIDAEVLSFVEDVMTHPNITSTDGINRFHNNKSKFIQFL